MSLSASPASRRAYNQTLAGRPGEQFVMLNGRRPRSRGVIPGSPRVLKEMQPGHDVFLTIDATLQTYADEALSEAVKKFKAKGGAAVIMDPHTGEVLAIANQPTFDPNDYQKSKPASWVCQAVTSPYEPGSTFKSVTACAAPGGRRVFSRRDGGMHGVKARRQQDHSLRPRPPRHRESPRHDRPLL